MSLKASLVGLTILNIYRGFDPTKHELRYRWSRPLWFFLTGVNMLNLVGTCYLGWKFTSMGEGTEAIR